jgi:hypothetical protein
MMQGFIDYNCAEPWAFTYPYNWRPQLSLFICLWCNMWSWEEVWTHHSLEFWTSISWHELSQLTCLLTHEYLSLSLSTFGLQKLPSNVSHIQVSYLQSKVIETKDQKDQPPRSPYWIIFHLMPYYVETGCSCPPNRLTLQTTLLSVNWLELGMRTHPDPFFLFFNYFYFFWCLGNFK